MSDVQELVTLSCVSNEVGGNLVGNAAWQGVRLATLLDRAGVQAGATQIVGRSVDGFTAGFPTEVGLDGRTALVAVAMNGEPLPAEHGFPARLVVAGLYGYVSATKWLDGIQLTTWEDFDGYWVPRGWSKEGPIKTASRIDVPRSGATDRRRPPADRRGRLGAAGRDHAGSRCRSTTASGSRPSSASRRAATRGCSGSSSGRRPPASTASGCGRRTRRARRRPRSRRRRRPTEPPAGTGEPCACGERRRRRRAGVGRAAAARPAVAGHPRPVADPRRRGDAAADAGAAGDPEVDGVLRRVPDAVGVRGGVARRRAAAVAGARLPAPGAQPARRGCVDRRAPRRCGARHDRGAAGAPRHRPVHGAGRAGVRLRARRRRGRHEHRPRARPGDGRAAHAAPRAGRRRRARAAGCRVGVEPGADGPRRRPCAGRRRVATTAHWRRRARGTSPAGHRPTRPTARPG